MSCFTCQSCGITNQFAAFIAATQPRAGSTHLHDILFDLLSDEPVVVHEVRDFVCPACGSTAEPRPEQDLGALGKAISPAVSEALFLQWLPTGHALQEETPTPKTTPR